MEAKDMGIGLSGFGVGPFPDRSRIRLLVNQWRLLPLAKALGFDEEEITADLEKLVDLFSGVGVGDFVENMRSVVPYVRIGALAIAETSFETCNGDKNKEDRTAAGERKIEEKATDVLALFSALYAYISSVERIGEDKANDFSLKVHAQLRDLPTEFLLNFPAFLAQVREEDPSRFMKRLYHYPDDHDNDDESFTRETLAPFAKFRMGDSEPLIQVIERLKRHSSAKNNVADSLSSAVVFIIKERKSLNLVDFFSGLVDGSIKPQMFTVTVPDETRHVRPLSRPDLHDPGSYLEALMVSLLVGRKGFIIKGINLNIAQEEGLGIMDGNYAEIGGEQRFGESLAQGYLDKESEGILKASILDGEAFVKAEEALGTLKTVMSRFKKESTKELKEVEKLDKLTKPVSLDTEVEDEEGGTTSLSECLPTEQDLLEAVNRYCEAVSDLPQDMQPLFRRVWEEGETPKQAALNLGYDWTSTLERQVERMIRKIRSKMTE